MTIKLQNALSKREGQIMEVIYRWRSASVYEVLWAIPNPPSYSAVRTILNILEDKGFLKHRKEGRKYIYFPTIPLKRAMRSAVKQLLQTYFNNSTEEAVRALVEIDSKNLTKAEFDRLAELIERARQAEEEQDAGDNKHTGDEPCFIEE